MRSSFLGAGEAKQTEKKVRGKADVQIQCTLLPPKACTMSES